VPVGVVPFVATLKKALCPAVSIVVENVADAPDGTPVTASFTRLE
jgi:hypothetical protein